MTDAGAPLALDRCMRLLDALAAQPDGATLTILSRTLGAPKSSLLSLLRGLKASGHVAEQDFVYRLGPAMFALARRIAGGEETLESIGAPILQRLASEAGETSILAVMAADGRAARYVAKVENEAALRFAATVGDRRPLHASASGLLLAAYRDDIWIEQFLRDSVFETFTDKTVIDPAMLRLMLRSIREEGFAMTNGSTAVGVTGLAVPVRDAQGEVRAALLLGGPSERMNRKLDPLRAALLRHAEALSGLPAALFDAAANPRRLSAAADPMLKESENA